MPFSFINVKKKFSHQMVKTWIFDNFVPVHHALNFFIYLRITLPKSPYMFCLLPSYMLYLFLNVNILM